jgi:peptidyl-prolyl cis-trans isomerase SurA
MQYKVHKVQFLLFIFNFLILSLFAQDKNIDGVDAIIGNNIVLHSDIEAQYMQYTSQGVADNGNLKCKIMEELMFQKLLVLQAALDSLKITDSQVDDELDKRIRYFVRQMGSKEKLEEYYKKSLYQIKMEFREIIKDLLLAQEVQQKITKDIKITPSEVKSFYKHIPADSLPMISSEVEVGEIVKQPAISPDEKKRVKQRINEIRDRIVNGEKFFPLAVLYSEDDFTSKNGGEIGTQSRGDLIPEFEAVAFSLKAGEVSPVIETQNGFYIIQVIDRKGDYINLRQILMKPKVSETDLYNCKSKLDSILPLILSGKISFEQAAQKYSDNLQSRNNKGLIVNLQTGNSTFQTEELSQEVFFSIDKMKVGDISKPMLFNTEDGRKAYRILYLKKRTDPHRANLKDDYEKIQTAALNSKKNDVIDDWIKSKTKTTYIRVMEDYKSCKFTHHWFLK